MYIPNDPVMLFSFLNTQLRDNYASLDDFCEDADVSKSELLEKLSAAGYEYDSDRNCFQ